jgi:hypothetical protein
MIEVAPCLLSRNAVGPHMERFDDRYNTHTSLEEKFDNPSNAGNNKNENLELRCIYAYMRVCIAVEWKNTWTHKLNTTSWMHDHMKK